MSMMEALELALAEASLPEQSGAAVALARKYAGLLDEATPAGKYRVPLVLLARVVEHYRTSVRLAAGDERTLDAMEATITNALGEHSVASDLGPKLLQVLTALNMALPATIKPTAEGEREQPKHPLAAERAEAQRLKLINGGQNGA